MNGSLEDRTRSFNSPPWESQGVRFHRGPVHSDSKGVGRTAARQPPRNGLHESRATADTKSGLSRRGVIYEYIREHPGVHVRGMANALGLATGDIQYHLLWLEKHGFVKTSKNGFYRFVYPTMVFKEEQELLLGVLARETPREILLCLLRDSAMTQSELVRSVGYSQPTISWHMDRLVGLGVVSKNRTRDGVLYEVAADRDDILRFVEAYHPEVWEKWGGMLGNVVVGAGVERVDEGGYIKQAWLAPPAVVE
jgi:DNA-binding transcriptional ArsR family regulator